jgi:streptogramin lyase
MALTRRAVVGTGMGFAVTGAQAAGKRIVTIVGSGIQGMAQDGDAAITATLDQPYGVCIGPDGALYWADFGSNRVLKLKSGKVFAAAGNGVKGHAGDGEKAVLAQLSAPHEVRFDSKANMLIAERDANVIRRIDHRTGIV